MICVVYLIRDVLSVESSLKPIHLHKRLCDGVAWPSGVRFASKLTAR